MEMLIVWMIGIATGVAITWFFMWREE